MTYSKTTIEKMVKRMAEPEFSSIPELSKETGIHSQTLYRWRQNHLTNKESIVTKKHPSSGRNSVEKFNLLLESSKLEGEELGCWLRAEGLHSESLNIWKEELRLSLNNRRKEISDELSSSQKRVKELERELTQKEKALAEMTTLIVLKKKVEILLSDAVR
jgi:transposase